MGFNSGFKGLKILYTAALGCHPHGVTQQRSKSPSC